MTFQEAIYAAHLGEGYKSGLQALKEQHRQVIECREPRNLTGSIDIDSALRQQFPTENRWDYGVGVRENQRESAIWIEVHPASTRNVDTVLKKLTWLKEWMRQNAPELWTMTRKQEGYVWVATGGVHITKNSRQSRQLAQAGLAFPRQRISLC